eukprot:CAMPEP_0115001532 /NCGR_PEP_ID=MMETSP0216-20121206/17438_1 /TAXON_ID=223996 /ORGANISM="Protocruzia adherens, Strain Boccale" /LENGTH=810 /DNA_ID=CAMNT_0002366897 /DNA_START=364 /DNA_END=2796 /DNA_ORIENTATION=+
MSKVHPIRSASTKKRSTTVLFFVEDDDDVDYFGSTATTSLEDLESLTRRKSRYAKLLLAYMTLSVVIFYLLIFTLPFIYASDCSDDENILPHLIFCAFLLAFPALEIYLFRPKRVPQGGKKKFYLKWAQSLTFEILDMLDLYTDVFFVATALIVEPIIGAFGLLVLVVTMIPRGYGIYLLTMVHLDKIPFTKNLCFKMAMCFEKLSFSSILNIIDSNHREKLKSFITVWKLGTENIPQLILEIVFLQLNSECENAIIYFAFATSLLGSGGSTAMSLYYLYRGIIEQREMRKHVEAIFSEEYALIESTINISRSGEIVRQVANSSNNAAVILEGQGFHPEHLKHLLERLNPNVPLWIRNGDSGHIREAIADCKTIKHFRFLKLEINTTTTEQGNGDDTDRSFVMEKGREEEYAKYLFDLCQGAADCASIETLNLSDAHLTDNILDFINVPLSESKNLRSLDLTDNRFKGATLADLMEKLNQNSHLEVLDVSFNKLNRVQTLFENLSGNTTIKRFIADTCNISRRDVASIATVIEKNSFLEELNLRDNDIDSSGAELLGTAFKSNKTLKKLNVELAHFGESGVDSFIKQLERNCEGVCLTNLNLGRMRVGANVAKILWVNIPLKSLSLACNNLERAGMEIVSEAIKSHLTLTHLNLADNKLKNKEIGLLAKGVRENKSIESFNLSSNEISDQGIDVLVDAIIHSRKDQFRKLRLTSNMVGETGAKKLSYLIKVCPAFESLDLEDNNLGDMGVAYLEEGLKASNKSLNYLNLVSNKKMTEKGHKRVEELRKELDLQILTQLSVDRFADEIVKA